MRVWRSSFCWVQNSSISGKIQGEGIANAAVYLEETEYATFSDSLGMFRFENLPSDQYKMIVKHEGFQDFQKDFIIQDGENLSVDVNLIPIDRVSDIVVTGTLKTVRRSDSPVAVEVYSAAYFKKNPTPNIFDALQNVNGVKPPTEL